MDKNFLDKLGLLRNPILVFGILGSMLLFGHGKDMLESAYSESRIAGIVLSLAAVIFMFSTLAAYIYAFNRLPRNAQERAFLDNTREQISQDKNLRNKEKTNERKNKRTKK